MSEVTVLKLGGSVLTGRDGYVTAADWLKERLAATDDRFVVVVSAEQGHTDELYREAQELASHLSLPQLSIPHSDLLDLLWSTGETRSVALLGLRLRALSVSSTGVSVHETGLRVCDETEQITFNPSTIRAALAVHRVVVVPGFLATRANRVVTLGRGGSDWSAVLLAASLGAARCELVKDVDGYFTTDPNTDEDAELIPELTYATALRMADDGCPLVQRQAIAEAARARLPLIIRSLASQGTTVQELYFPIEKPGVTPMDFATKTIHFNQPCDPATGAVVSPIYQTTTFQQEGPGENKGFDYSRTNNPTRKRLEGVLAELEGGTHCSVFGSGLAAEHAILQAYLKPGTEIVVPQDVYGGTFRMLHKVFEPIGCKVTSVDFSDLEAVSRVVTNQTKLVWLESPTNPRLLVYDIRAIAKIAHAKGALVVVDNTFATPYFQKPFELGADLILHSVTKYLAGHSDLIQGCVIGNNAAIFEPVGFLLNALGGVPSAFDCWLTLRGLKTLELRMERHASTAVKVAEALQAHPRVKQVYFPGLPNHPGHAIARAQMTGFGGMVSFELDGTLEEAETFVKSRTYFALGESLGGVRALVCLPCKMTHASIPAETRHALGLADTLIRLSPGIESTRDLVNDLIEGLDALGAKTSTEELVAAGR